MDRKKLREKVFYVNRFGLDLDNMSDTDFKVWFASKFFPYKSQFEKLDIFKSASKTGYHIELYLKKPISVQDSFRFREKLGDDKKRLMFSKADYSRGWDFDILFKYKKIGDVWKSREFIEQVILI